VPRRPATDAGSTPRAATIRDVATRAGVSVATVSRVLTGNYPVAAATRTKVLRAVRDLDYVVNAHARALSGNRSKMIAVLLSNFTSTFFNGVASGVEAQAMAEDRLCMVGTTGADPEREVKLVETLREQNVDAVILVGGVIDTPEYREHMARLARLLDSAGSRLVVCGRPSPGDNLPVTVVEYDNAGGAFAATSHLLSLGHRRILFVGGHPANTTTRARLEGYRRAIAAYGVEEDPRLVVVGSHTSQFAYAELKKRLAEGPPDFTAVFAWDDPVAARALVAIREAGLSVPDDISVIGYNDDRESQDLYPALTTVSIPHMELGREAVRLALHRDESAAQSQHVMLGTHIVLRDSVRPLIHR